MTRPDHAVHRPVGRPAVRGGVPARRPSGATTGWRSPAGATTSTSTGRSTTTSYVRRPARHPGEARPAGVRDLQPPRRARRSATTRSTSGTGASCPTGSGATATPEGVRQRAAEEMKTTARAAARLGRRHRHRLHRLVDLEVRRDVPAGAAGHDRRRLPGLRRPVEPDPRRVRRGRGAVRARGAPVRDRLRLLDDACARWRRSGTGQAFGLNWDPSPLRLAGPRPGRLPLGLQGPDLPRRLQGREAAGRQRPQRPARLAPAVGRPAPRLGLRVHRPRRRAVGGLLPDAQHHRLRRPDLGRVGGRRDGPPASARRRRSSSSAAARLRPAAAAFDAAFSSR